MIKKLLSTSIIATTLILLTGCQTANSLWEDTKTAANFINQKTTELIFGSQQQPIAQAEDFRTKENNQEFIPLKESDLKPQYVDFPSQEKNAIKASQHREPSTNLSHIFRKVHFNTDDHEIKVKEYFNVLKRISDYLKENPNITLFVGGHCDQRGSEEYNLALGSRRANYVRKQLIKYGIANDRIYTISYGKDQPAVSGNHKAAWAKNRRVDFKLFDNKDDE